MKHVYLLIFTILFYTNVVSQNDLLGTWYLHALTLDGSQEANMFNEDSHIIFNTSGSFDGDAICNSFSGNYTITNTSTIDIYVDGWTLIECAQESYNLYEYKYEDILLGYNTPDPNLFNYQITGSGNEEALTFTDANGNILSYGRQPLPTFNLFGTWELQYMVVDGTQINTTDAFSLLEFRRQQTSINTYDFLGSAICNGYGGDFSVIDDTVTFNTFYATQANCDDPLEDTYIYSILHTSTDGSPTTLRYVNAINGDEEGLMLINESNGNQAYYYNQALSIEDFDQNAELSIFPNPATDIINVKGLDAENATYSIVSIQGKVIANTVALKNNSIPVALLSSGLYFLQLRHGDLSETIKFIKE